jgi:hypothetical protein
MRIAYGIGMGKFGVNEIQDMDYGYREILYAKYFGSE